jgi:tetratricopeptide (TPR) repeat protein
MRKFEISMACAIALTFMSVVALAQSPWADSYRHEAAGSYAAAVGPLAPILAAEPDNEFARLRVAWLEYLDGDYNASIRDYQRAMKLNAESLDAQLGLTLPLLAQQRWREAAASAQAVLKVAPWNYYAHVRLMVAEEGQRQWQTLARHARAVADRYPTDATLLVYLARAEARQGNIETARTAYADVIERVPGHAEAMDFIATNQ